jgi:hypothetical protein
VIGEILFSEQQVILPEKQQKTIVQKHMP